ncbi:response regulator transcription factor [Sediminispirochaeta smaragdinae]|jgi:DNA-binding NarL/FixJ family response regulator|uniref:Two component transcriptional regulator, LuxR family n=1 Tax=Sediminispirochaeta smaragdinae (strain DSM 11293 / JCM 15392 / SEBR 4228) TaxID=573413 RepID=E1R885_SEDSS|nr:response regulator transcription factor [Sediminispirochaeta smaragdinae]ADK82940.1 two component transcriptional regulator, LuxR family [Sediminispirochaeta smaragdinae DSM 11293]
MIELVIADDQVLFVDTLKSVIEHRAKDIHITGVAYDGKTALRIIEQTNPDVALLDVKMPYINGLELSQKLYMIRPGVKVIILTTFPDDEFVEQALQHGAAGYLLKNMLSDDLINSIRMVHSGNILISEKVGSVLQQRDHNDCTREKNESFTKTRQELLRQLSRREREVYGLMLQGYSNDEIAEMLFIATQTVKNHIRSIYSKSGFHNRSDIIHLDDS